MPDILDQAIWGLVFLEVPSHPTSFFVLHPTKSTPRRLAPYAPPPRCPTTLDLSLCRPLSTLDRTCRVRFCHSLRLCPYHTNPLSPTCLPRSAPSCTLRRHSTPPSLTTQWTRGLSMVAKRKPMPLANCSVPSRPRPCLPSSLTAGPTAQFIFTGSIRPCTTLPALSTTLTRPSSSKASPRCRPVIF